jgi:carboxyl-terminal processing protease
MKVRTLGGILSWTAVLALAVLIGSQYGTRVEAMARAEDDYEASLKTFTSLLSLVEANHATEVNPEVAVYGAIEGMLRTLDPHSRFFAPTAFTQLREDQSGTYYGLGITVTSRGGPVTVVSPPFPGAPAEKVGLRVGDVISRVNGESTEGANLNAVVGRLKGPKGTPVNITIVRPGLDEPFDLEVIRDEISKFTISNKFEIVDGVGYIKIDSFAETTGDELRQALRELGAPELDGLVLDLRGNPGGLLQQAIEVSETFLLERGQLIVETRGRVGGSDRDYRSSGGNDDGPYPLVVVIDRASASASEIVAGAIQDHDRGLIVGETSFGKGLVQSVYPLSKNGGLALTTQKWYTPSGRLIQRDYSELSEFDYYNARDEHPPTPDEIRYSDLGRIVYGGGGITPDHIVEAGTPGGFAERFPRMSPPFAFYSFVQEFLDSDPEIPLEFEVTDELMSDFAAHVRGRDIELTDAEIAENRDYLALEIRYEIFYNRFGVTEAWRVLLGGDPQIQEAIRLIPDARDLVQRAVVARNDP